MTSQLIKKENKVLTVALLGNPNSGKSTVFNALTKLRQKVANYPGVTVEKKLGRMVLSDERIVNVIDLPGTYSLAVRSPDEKVAHDVLMGRMKDTCRPDVVVCIVDASNVERNLFLVSQILDLGLPVIIALNMMDEMALEGREIDVKRLAAALGVPVVPMVASKGKGVDELKRAIVEGGHCPPQRRWVMPELMEKEVEKLVAWLIEKKGFDRKEAFSEAVIGISKANIDKDSSVDLHWIKQIQDARGKLVQAGIDWRSAAIEARYAAIHQTLDGVVKQRPNQKTTITQRLDAILTHKILGWLFFIAVMAGMFYTIFSVASYPMDWIDKGFSFLAEITRTRFPEGDLRDLLVDGVIAGVGGVVVFLPQILILFFFICLLQDTGYMARAAFIMDRLMSRVGLHGKSFIPLLSSFACAIPGIMATRSIESPKDRLVTILVAPLMTCSARLPVFTLMIAVLMPGTSALQKAGIMLTLYLLGIVGAIGVAWVFKKTLLRSPTPPFIMELPPYRCPSIKGIFLHMWERSGLFLKKAGTVIFALSILLWALMTYPKQDQLISGEALKHSFAGKVGVMLEPAIKPLGYDWRIGIGLIGSFAAREVFVSTMSIVFNIDEDMEIGSLRDAFLKAKWPDGRPLFTPLACVSLMIFYIFAMQCVSTLAVVRRETNSWRWPLFQLVYMTVLAYMLALIVFQGGRWLGWQ
ncbi:MAG TPA: ferrous iron transport protein B [Candidatus Omnitrophica bacterium]|nr:MAG: ferrous iron transport protein B [Omnitrophica WOR_2 bacterium GWA2_45_18]OGX20631.1 MAG: ferrous iron transport protein B [Omnitrophica WOR_2 bacterium GWC2_45_7]HBR15325.1 ferrous iron transport protein B [Candidatus Omnitrophota bacterium]